MGHAGAALVSLTILISTFGTTNGNIMTASVSYISRRRATACFFGKFGMCIRFETPAVSILGQGMGFLPGRERLAHECAVFTRHSRSGFLVG
jgi:hypothetical protein